MRIIYKKYDNLTLLCKDVQDAIVKSQNDKKNSIDSLYYAISALLLFCILNIYPIISLTLNDTELKATLINTVLILFEQNFFLLD